jgi:uncharacterized protein YjiS (DUF1127 family)
MSPTAINLIRFGASLSLFKTDSFHHARTSHYRSPPYPSRGRREMTSFTALTVAEKPQRAFRPNGEEPVAGPWRLTPVAAYGASLPELMGLARRSAESTGDSATRGASGDLHTMGSQAVTRQFSRAHAARAFVPTAGFAAGTGEWRIGAILALPFVWCRRARFRARLREDLRDNADFLNDIGVRVHEAQAEARRFFWERILLKHP